VTLLTVAILAMMVLAIILAALPKPCICEHCAFHRAERHTAFEAEVSKRHREKHAAFNLPWPAPACPECKAGRSYDEPRR